MIAESVDLGSGTLGIALVGTLLILAAGGGAAYATIRHQLGAVAKDVHALGKHLREATRDAEDHRVEDDARFADQGRRLDRLEIVVDLTPIHGIDIRDRPPTGPQPRLRGDTPRPRRHEDTGPGESR